MMSIPRAGIIIRCGEEYLSVYQNASKLWGFPKGRIKQEQQEKFIDCALRELNEETGITLSRELLLYKNLIPIKRGKHHHYYYYVELNEKPEVKIDNDEIGNYRWISLQEFINLHEISFFTAQVLKKLEEFHKNPVKAPIHEEYNYRKHELLPKKTTTENNENAKEKFLQTFIITNPYKEISSV